MYNQAAAEEAGAEFYFGTTAEYIIMENGAVAGLVASDADGYVKITCKAVVCACGGMGGNPDMMAYFMPDMAQALVEGESLNSMSANDGRGVQMAYWAGAHLETTPIPGMNMKGLSVPGKMNCLPQAVWIDESGKRFCNEFYPTSEQRGYQTTFMSRKTKYAVCDNNFTEYRQYTPAPARRLQRHRREHRRPARVARQGLREVQGHLRGARANRGRGSGRPWPHDRGRVHRRRHPRGPGGPAGAYR
ncbi:MAG: FAD-binding protein [Adlercreutzia equolifaciens]